MLRRRPDVIAAERRLAASNERIGAAISGYYPKVSLAGALGLDSLNSGHLFTSQAFQPVGAAGLSWRLFDFGKVDAEVAQARGANAESLALYRQSVLRAVEDVENALSMLAQTEAYVTQLQAQVQSLTSARDLSQMAYRAGSITLTDVLDADRQLLVAQDELDANRAGAARAAKFLPGAMHPGFDCGDRNIQGIRNIFHRTIPKDPQAYRRTQRRLKIFDSVRELISALPLLTRLFWVWRRVASFIYRRLLV